MEVNIVDMDEDRIGLCMSVVIATLLDIDMSSRHYYIPCSLYFSYTCKLKVYVIY